MKTRIRQIAVLFFFGFFVFNFLPERLEAMISPHPIQLYERGEAGLKAYHGDPAQLHEAQKSFKELLQKYPYSPFGYLGMSRIHTINAYRYGTHYNMEEIRAKALPFAIKALELGPSIKAVHENYAIFERIFDQFAINQKQAQDSLLSSPEDAATYFVVAGFLRNQGEYAKALGYYKTALTMSPSQSMRLRIFKRIALIYSENYQQAEESVKYYKQALKIREDSSVHYNLGNLYYKQGEYERAYSHFKHVIDLRPQDSNAYYFAGRSAQSLGNTDLAKDYYKKYLQLGIDNQKADWIRKNMPEFPSRIE